MKTFNESNGFDCQDLEVDDDNSIFIAGSLSGSEKTFDHISIYPKSTDPFFAKLDTDGNVLFVVSDPQNSSKAKIKDLVLSENKIIVAGTYDSSFAYPYDEAPLKHISSTEVYVALYDQDGHFEQVLNICGNCEDDIKELAVTENAVYALGSFSCDLTIADSTYQSKAPMPGSENVNNTFLASFDFNDERKSYQSSFFVQDPTIIIYPNPSAGELKIDLTNLLESEDENYTLELTDITGHRLYYDDRQGLPLIYQLESLSLPVGIYVLTIRTANATFAEQVIFK